MVSNRSHAHLQLPHKEEAKDGVYPVTNADETGVGVDSIYCDLGIDTRTRGASVLSPEVGGRATL
jgi:hypothetical protein